MINDVQLCMICSGPNTNSAWMNNTLLLDTVTSNSLTVHNAVFDTQKTATVVCKIYIYKCRNVSVYCTHHFPLFTRLKNSALVCLSVLKLPSKLLVIVLDPAFSTPRITIHMCL